MAYAEQIVAACKTPIMVTGGFRTRAAMEEALTGGVAMIGIARPLCVDPDAPARLLGGEIDALEAWESRLKLGSGYFGPNSPNDIIKAANGFAIMAFFYRNILRLGDGKPTRRKMTLFFALLAHQLSEHADAKRFWGY